MDATELSSTRSVAAGYRSSLCRPSNLRKHARSVPLKGCLHTNISQDTHGSLVMGHMTARHEQQDTECGSDIVQSGDIPWDAQRQHNVLPRGWLASQAVAQVHLQRSHADGLIAVDFGCPRLYLPLVTVVGI